MATSQDAAVKQKRSALGVMKLFSGAIIQPIVFLSVVGIVLAVCVILRLSFMPAVIQTIGTFFFNVFLPAGISNLPVIIMIGLSVAFAHKKRPMLLSSRFLRSSSISMRTIHSSR